MAEHINITWRVTLRVNPNVTTRYPLSKVSSHVGSGKWTTPPPTHMDHTYNQPVIFRASGKQGTAIGTEGTVVFESGDSISAPTTFTFKFDIPFSGANSGGVDVGNSGNGNYTVEGGMVPPTGNSVVVDVIITQIAPIV